MGSSRATKLWLSSDGRNWTPTDFPFVPGQWATDAFAFTDKLMLVNYRGDILNVVLDLWESADGTTWKRLNGLTVAARSDRECVSLTMMALGNRLAAYGAFIPGACTGGAQPAEVAGTDLERFVWLSRDGVRWTRHVLSGGGSAASYAVGVRDGIAYGLAQRGAKLWLVESDDLVRWSLRFRLPKDVDPDGAYGFSATATGWVLAADTSGTRGGPSHATIWTATEDGIFSETFDHAGWFTYPVSVASDGQTVLVTGRDDPNNDAAIHPFVLVSTDSGVSWELSAGWPRMEGGLFGAVAIHGQTAVVRSYPRIEDMPNLFVADLSSLP